MSDEEKEKVLDLLCDKFVFGLSEDEARELERLGYDPDEAESIEQTIAMLGLVDADAEAQMPASLTTKLLRDADEHFGTDSDERPVPVREIVIGEGPNRSWFGWLGWAVAAAACLVLAVTLFTRPAGDLVDVPPTPTPTPGPQESLTPAQQRQKLMESTPQLVRAEWTKGKMENMNVSGDVVWSEEKQVGYMRLVGLPKNDPNRESYQLWIIDSEQDPKTPIDGGVFDVNTEGEVIIPIDAKIKAKNPKAFAITIEKPGGVVVSRQEKLAALAPVKPDQV